MLARREHSYFELQQKLMAHYDEAEIIEALAQLRAQNYQSDARFASEFVHMRFNQGKGKRLISQQLKQKGIEHFDFSGFDFFQLAADVRLKKYGAPLPKAAKDKTKQMRFLQSRGFGFDEINAAFES